MERWSTSQAGLEIVLNLVLHPSTVAKMGLYLGRKVIAPSPLGVVVVYRNDDTTTFTHMVSPSRVDTLTNNLRANEHNNNNQCSL